MCLKMYGASSSYSEAIKLEVKLWTKIPFEKTSSGRGKASPDLNYTRPAATANQRPKYVFMLTEEVFDCYSKART